MSKKTVKYAVESHESRSVLAWKAKTTIFVVPMSSIFRTKSTDDGISLEGKEEIRQELFKAVILSPKQ